MFSKTANPVMRSAAWRISLWATLAFAVGTNGNGGSTSGTDLIRTGHAFFAEEVSGNKQCNRGLFRLHG